jgi:hypothetical protein
MKVNNNRKVGAVFNMLLVLLVLFCTGYYFSELAKTPASKERSLAIIGKTLSVV